MSFAPLQNDTFLRACLGQATEHTPVWLMRQAGRYLPEYCATRARAGSFMGLATNVDYATEVTLQPLAGEGVQRPERLVHEDDLRLVGEHPRDLGALLHTSGQLVGAGSTEVGQAHHVQEGVGAGSPLGPGQAPVWRSELDVAAHRQPGEQVGLLEDDPALQGRLLDRDATPQRPPLRGRDEAGQDPQQRGLAAAGRPHEGDELAGGDVEVDAVERVDRTPALRAVGVRDAVDPQVPHRRRVAIGRRHRTATSSTASG